MRPHIICGLLVATVLVVCCVGHKAEPASKRNMTHFPLTVRSFTDFDWLAVLDSTAYNRGRPPLP